MQNASNRNMARQNIAWPPNSQYYRKSILLLANCISPVCVHIGLSITLNEFSFNSHYMAFTISM